MANLWSKASSLSSPFTYSFLDDDADLLSAWEIIDPSDDEDFSFDDDDDDDGFGSLSSDLSAKSLLDHLISDHHDDDGIRDVVVKDESLSDNLICNEQFEEEEEEEDDDDDDDDDDGDGDAYDDGYELDDELVPKCVTDRFGRQRLRKLGKRAYPKMNKSKRLPYYYNRPGCVHGKHGLGLKHSVI